MRSRAYWVARRKTRSLVATLVSSDFSDPDAAGQALAVVGREPRSGGALQALGRLLAFVKPGTEAVTAMTALTAAVSELVN